MKLPAGAGTGAILGVLITAALLFAVPGGGKSDKLQPITVKPIVMVPAPAPAAPPVVAAQPEPPAAPEPPPVLSAAPPAKPGLHPRPHDKAMPAKVPPPGLPPQPAQNLGQQGLVTPPAQPKPAAAAAPAAKPSAWQCFKLRQAANGMTPAEQQDYAAKYMTADQRAAAKACLGTK